MNTHYLELALGVTLYHVEYAGIGRHGLESYVEIGSLLVREEVFAQRMLNAEQRLVMAVLLIGQVCLRQNAYGARQQAVFVKERQDCGRIGKFDIGHLDTSLKILGV